MTKIIFRLFVSFSAAISLSISLSADAGSLDDRTVGARRNPASMKSIHYVGMFMENEPLCRPLLNFYNAHLNDRDGEERGFIEDRFGSELSSAKFAKKDKLRFLNLNSPRSIDIFNNGDMRYIDIINKSINYKFVTTYSVVLIMKKNRIYDQKTDEYSDDVDFWIDFNQGG